MSGAEEELQASEREVLISTFAQDDFFLLSRDTDDVFEGSFTAFMRLPVGGISLLTRGATSDGREQVQVAFLPPLTLTFKMPNGYPSECDPEYRLLAPWVGPCTQVRLEQELSRLCEENRGGFVLFAMCMFLQDEAINCLELHKNCLDLSVLSNRPAVQAGLLRLILDSEQEQKALEFSRLSHTCPVCGGSNTGFHFVLFQPCGHKFCRECVSRGFEVYIREGEMDKVKCLECDNVPPQHQLQTLVSEELYERYERLVLSRGLETMSDVMPCPRKDCEIPVLVDLEEGMGVCSACNLAFCIFCKRTYHGVNPCSIQNSDNLVLEFVNADSKKKLDFIKRYGQRNLDKLVENYASDQYLKSSVRCPSCKVATEKIDGCNKMTCSKCGTFFCWLCHAHLNRLNPYAHFSSGSCANQLFLGMDEEWDDWEPFV